jgi:hypothetical protein
MLEMHDVFGKTVVVTVFRRNATLALALWRTQFSATPFSTMHIIHNNHCGGSISFTELDLQAQKLAITHFGKIVTTVINTATSARKMVHSLIEYLPIPGVAFYCCFAGDGNLSILLTAMTCRYPDSSCTRKQGRVLSGMYLSRSDHVMVLDLIAFGCVGLSDMGGCTVTISVRICEC